MDSESKYFRYNKENSPLYLQALTLEKVTNFLLSERIFDEKLINGGFGKKEDDEDDDEEDLKNDGNKLNTTSEIPRASYIIKRTFSQSFPDSKDNSPSSNKKLKLT